MQIKKYPDDFIVEELPDINLKDSGEYAVYKLRKISLNTEDAIQDMCETLHIKRNDVKYAGAKDRNSVSTQYISIHKDKGNLKFERPNLSIGFAGFSDEPLSLGTLKGNRFEIIVRDICGNESNDVEKINIIPNYFDEQRFSENNFEIGLAIIRKDFRKACEIIKSSDVHHESMIRMHLDNYPNDYVGAIRMIPEKIISMYIHSVQSLLFNNALSRILKERAGRNNIKYDEIKYSQGEFIFYKDEKDYEKIFIKELSLVGFDTNILQTEIAEQMKSLEITQRDFIIRAIPEMTVEGSSRACFVQVSDFTSEKLDEKTLKLKFSLPKGSYATIVVKALIG